MRVESSPFNLPNLAGASIAARGISNAEKSGADTFVEFLASKTQSAGAAAAPGTGEASRPSASRTTPGASSGRTSRSVPGNESETSAPPFSGPDGGEAPREIDEIMARARGWEAYFITHAPSEWFRQSEARANFAEIYGQKALVTLDWTLTVPVNYEPAWVTNQPVDDSGKPLPCRHTISESNV